MEIIPAIDLREGKCVRLVQGDYGRQMTFGDPVDYALRWVGEGARRLHVVDLDGAREGRPRPENLAAVTAIVRRTGIPVQMGGGIRSVEVAEEVLGLGVDRVIVGTSIAADLALAGEFFSTFGERVVAGIDARAGRVAVQGWLQETDWEAPRFALQMTELGAARLIFTDIARDGTQTGANLAALKALAEAVAVPVIASGGIGSIEDLVRLRAEAPANVEGVIVGRALYTGAVRLLQALAAVA